jgi:hypothetical protein
MQWVRLPSGTIVNIDNLCYVFPTAFNTVNNQSLSLYTESGVMVATCEKEDAVFLYWFLDYMSSDTKFTGFDGYLEYHKNDKI